MIVVERPELVTALQSNRNDMIACMVCALALVGDGSRCFHSRAGSASGTAIMAGPPAVPTFLTPLFFGNFVCPIAGAKEICVKGEVSG